MYNCANTHHKTSVWVFTSLFVLCSWQVSPVLYVRTYSCDRSDALQAPRHSASFAASFASGTKFLYYERRTLQKLGNKATSRSNDIPYGWKLLRGFSFGDMANFLIAKFIVLPARDADLDIITCDFDCLLLLYNLQLRRASLFGQISAASCGDLVRINGESGSCGRSLVGSGSR